MENKEGKKNKNQSIKTATLVMLVCSLLLLLAGVTFAVYQKFIVGTTENIINAGVISFSYDEATFNGNGVKIEEALPISDNKGKLLKGTNEYFDFSITANSTISTLSYQVLVLKQSNSTLNDDYVKVYLTIINGDTEIASPMVVNGDKVLTYGELVTDTNTGGKIVYNGVVNMSSNTYYQDFRLRLWISDEVDVQNNFTSKTFSVKVKVVANEVS